MYKIHSQTLKPGKIVHHDVLYELEGTNYFEVADGDNGIVLVIEANIDSFIEILPGDSVLAGGSKRIPVYYEGKNYIYLESGRYVTHNSDGTKTIRFLCEDEGIYCAVIQLV